MEGECFEFSHVCGEGSEFGTKVEEAWEDRGDAECGEFFQLGGRTRSRDESY